MISVATFRARFPEFSDVTAYPDARIQLFIDDSVLFLGSDESRWCGKYDLAQAYYSAHLLTLATATESGDSSAKAGSIISKSAGGVSVTRSAVAKDRSAGDDQLYSTSYGQQFVVIRNSCFVGVLVANAL